MKLRVLFILFFSLTLLLKPAAAQEKNYIPDSLLQQIHSGNDTVVIKALVALASPTFSKTPETIRKISGIALKLSDKIGWYPGRQRALQYIGLSWQNAYLFDSAETYYLKAAEEAMKENDYKNAGRCYGSVGLLALNLSQYDRSAEFFDIAYEAFRKCNDSLGMGMCMLNGSQNFSARGNISSALRYNYKALSIGLAIKNDILINGSLNNIGVALLDNEDWESAQKTMQLVYKLSLRSGDVKSQANALNNLGITTQNLGDTLSSFKYYNEFLKLAINLNDYKEMGLAYNNLGSLYFSQEKLDKAEEYFRKAFALAEELGAMSSMSHYTRNISDVYLKNGSTEKGIEYAYKAYLWADSCQSMVEKVQSLKNLYEGYGTLKDDKNSLAYLKEYLALNDSLKGAENTMSLQDLKMKFESEQSEQQIKLLEKEMALKENRFLLAGVLVVLVVLVLVMIIRFKNLKVKSSMSEKALMEANLRNARIERDSLKKELEFKNKELSLAAINLVQKHEFMESINQQLQESIRLKNDQQKSSIQKQISFNQNLEKDRAEFQQMVDLAQESFFVRLTEKYPVLSENDKRLCALLRLNLSSKEISVILGISPASVDMSRHRLRKKLGIASGDNLLDIFDGL